MMSLRYHLWVNVVGWQLEKKINYFAGYLS